MTARKRPTIYVAGGYASGFVAEAIKAEAQRTGAKVVGRLDLPKKPKLGAVEAWQEITGPLLEPLTERERQIISLRLGSPKRADSGKAPRDQQDAGHLPLFIAANEPRLL